MVTGLRIIGVSSVIVLCFTNALAADPYDSQADTILQDSGVKGGLVVHVGATDGKLTAALGAKKQYVVQGLSADAAAVKTARDFIKDRGLYGRVSVRQWSGSHLPYGDGIVNLIVIRGEGTGIQEQELLRVLAPRGVALVNGKKIVKELPAEIDEWTHFLHDATGNAVAKDAQVAPPRTLKWDSGPKYSRNHEIDSSTVAMVTAKGRLFSIVDQGPLGMMDKRLPETWALVARDAFSGVLLWKKPLKRFGWPEWKPEIAKLDTWAGLSKAQRRKIPITLPRRLVAVGDKVYVSLGYGEPVTALDGATGSSVTTYKQTEGCDEFIIHDNVLVLTVRKQSREKATAQIDETGIVTGVDVKTGDVLWETAPGRVLPMTLTADDERVYYHTGNDLICLNRKTGEKIWSTQNANVKAARWDSNHTLLAYQDMIFLASLKKLEAFSAKTGKVVWTGKGGRKPFASSQPPDLYIADGLLWIPPSKDGRDPLTGEVKRTLTWPKFMHTPGHHLRCYRGKATDRYLLDNKRGIEFIDIKDGKHLKHDWVRGVCRYGIMPANGLIYTTPTPCSCYPSVQLKGFNALSGTPTDQGRGAAPSSPLVKGPAFGKVESVAVAEDDWATLRYDVIRNGVTQTTVSASPKKAWETLLGGKLTQPIIVGNTLYVASTDTHTLHALDAESGEKKWEFTADARIDSAPTFHRGMLLFGARDGRIYSLSAADGTLAWSFRAAPQESFIVSYDQLESAWPIHGSVLVLDDVVYFAAGRNSFVNNGIYLYGLDPVTGGKKYEGHLNDEPQDPVYEKGGAHSMRGSTNDVLSSDGNLIFMLGKTFDKELKFSTSQGKDRIVTNAGFLDDTAWNRNFWVYSSAWKGYDAGKGNMGMLRLGEILVIDDTTVYGIKYFLDKVGQSMIFVPQTKGYCLFADKITGGEAPKKKKKKQQPKEPGGGATKWSAWIPIRVRGMVKAGDHLFVAGDPDVIDPKDPLAAFQGRKGGVLQSFSAADGKAGNPLNIEAPPVFDGLVAAKGRLFMSDQKGQVVCFK
jgi:outer membrane protein assembly factor BamB